MFFFNRDLVLRPFQKKYFPQWFPALLQFVKKKEAYFSLNSFSIMLAKLQQTFPEISESVILDAWNYFQTLDKTETILNYVAENTLKFYFFMIKKKILMDKYSKTSKQQKHLMKLFVKFYRKVENATILQKWSDCKQIYYDTVLKLKVIYSIKKLNVYKIILIIISKNMIIANIWNKIDRKKKEVLK
ncbi:hypothetical protein RFI_07051 [Reticulomyxa filosa]|uniref:Uncharacterized protein n=1 Tax=Reticulomyxa filosa TaxID=46433 RepID=X6NVN0_RETFI|nr:hypothetical protein RFI_07051 [Reticulomyxa filosa]|eukprot:ETO30071.1 hypothetical protein RFI_07051 [Reticulomyxa filosa]